MRYINCVINHIFNFTMRPTPIEGKFDEKSTKGVTF